MFLFKQILCLTAILFLTACGKDNSGGEPSPTTTLELSSSTLTFPFAGGVQTITVTTDAADWTYSGGNSWITPAKNNNLLTVEVLPNNSLGTRKATVTIIAANNAKTEYLTITQSGETSGPYSIGSIYHENGVVGVVYKVNAAGMQGMIVSLKDTICRWSTRNVVTGATNRDNGLDNMGVIKRINNWAGDYPVFKWCDDLNKGGVTGWYLPAQNELADLYAGFCGLSSYPGFENDAPTRYKEARAQFNVILERYGGMAMTTAWHWSSSENDGSTVWSQGFYHGYQGEASKSTSHRVRAVRAF